MIWGWIITSVFSLCTTVCLAEMSSLYPAAGSVYHYTAVLAPSQGTGAILGIICGWSNLIGNISIDASFAFSVAQISSATLNVMSEGNSEIDLNY
jgi:amino acid transporter